MDCLALHSDELWHLAKIESVDENKICVQFKKINLTCALDWESILLLNSINTEDEESSSSSSDSCEDEDINSSKFNYLV